MAFLDYVKQVLASAAPEKYPVLIGKDLFAVVILHDDYVDLRFGTIYVGEINIKTVAVTTYIRSMPFTEIKSIQAIPDWHIIRIPDEPHPLGTSTVSLEDIERQAPGFIDAFKTIVRDQRKSEK